MANETKMAFAASSTTVISLTAALADGDVAGGTTELDNSTDLYLMATATLHVPDTFAAAPNDRSDVKLYMVRTDVDGTDDDTSTPTGTDVEAAEYVGSFIIYDTDEAQRNTIVISLNGVRKAKFYIKNNCGQALSYTAAAITVKVHPYTLKANV